MNKLKKGISLFVIVLILAGITTAYVTVHGLTTFYGTAENPSENPVSGVGVVLYDSYYNILGSDSTDSNGDYSFTATLSGHSPYNLYAIRARFDTEVEPVTGGGRNDFEMEGDGFKLAYLFYANDATDEVIVAEYEEILEEEDYTVDMIGDCANVESKCEDIADYEIYSDTIFVYVIGHGEYDEEEENSYTFFNKERTQDLGSHEFKGYMDDWEAERKCILVDSCYSGGWADDFAESPYLAMSSTDEDHPAHLITVGFTSEGAFSRYFFDYVDSGHTAVQSYNYAETFCDEETDPYTQYPKKEDYSSYTWFN